MCCSKNSSIICTLILPFSILIIFLFQIYAQYSTLLTQRTKIDNIRDGRNTLTNYQLTKDKQYDFNMNRVQDYFESNCLMRINFLKQTTLRVFDSLNNKKGEVIDIRVYMFYYLIFYDLICIIIVYFFVYGSIKAGFIKIVFQIIRFYFNAKRIQKFNSHINLYYIIKSKIDNMYTFRGWNIFTPEGFLIIEFICNITIILDIIYLIILVCNYWRYKKYKNMDKKLVELDEDSNKDETNDDEKIIKDNENDGIIKEIKLEEDNIVNESEKGNNNKNSGTLNVFENEEDEESINISDELDNDEPNKQ